MHATRHTAFAIAAFAATPAAALPLADSRGHLQQLPEGPAFLVADARRIAFSESHVAWGDGALLVSDHSLEPFSGVIPPSSIESLHWYDDTLLALTRVHGLLVLELAAGELCVAAQLPLPDIHELTDMAVLGDRAFVAGWFGGRKPWGDPTGYLFEIDVGEPRDPVLLGVSSSPRFSFGYVASDNPDLVFLSASPSSAGGPPSSMVQARRIEDGDFAFEEIWGDSNDAITAIAVGGGGLFVSMARLGTARPVRSQPHRLAQIRGMVEAGHRHLDGARQSAPAAPCQDRRRSLRRPTAQRREPRCSATSLARDRGLWGTDRRQLESPRSRRRAGRPGDLALRSGRSHRSRRQIARSPDRGFRRIRRGCCCRHHRKAELARSMPGSRATIR